MYFFCKKAVLTVNHNYFYISLLLATYFGVCEEPPLGCFKTHNKK